MTINKLAQAHEPPSPQAGPTLPRVGSSTEREWLTELIRHAVFSAHRDIPRTRVRGRGAYIVGYLLSHSQFSQEEADALLSSIS